MTDSATDLDEFLGKSKPGLLDRYGKWIALVIVLAIAALFLSQCFSTVSKTEYLTEDAKRGDIAVTVTATGNLAPTNQVDVGSEISGIVESVDADVNDRVRKGQSIAIIDTSRLDDAVTRSKAALRASEANVAQARATVHEAQAQLARLQDVYRLSGGQVPAQSEMATQVATAERATAGLRSAEANVVSARAQLSSDQTQVGKAVIRSPVAGVVLKRTIDPGQTVQASFNTPSLFLIAEDLTQMKLEVSVDEADVGQVHEGQPASFTVDAYPGRVFPATIVRVNLGSKNLSGSSSASSSATSNTSVVSYLASLKLSNADLTLRPGMTATATIATAGTKNALLVPNAALRFVPATPGPGTKPSGITLGPPSSREKAKQERVIGIGSQQRVYVLEANHTLRAVTVVTGQTDGRYTAVSSSGLKPGMTLATGLKAQASAN